MKRINETENYYIIKLTLTSTDLYNKKYNLDKSVVHVGYYGKNEHCFDYRTNGDFIPDYLLFIDEYGYKRECDARKSYQWKTRNDVQINDEYWTRNVEIIPVNMCAFCTIGKFQFENADETPANIDIDFSVTIANDDNDTKTREYTAHRHGDALTIESKTTDFITCVDISGIPYNKADTEKYINLWAFEYWTGENGAYLLISTSLGYKNENRVIEKSFTMRNECAKYNAYILGLIEKWAQRLDASECTINNIGEITLMNKDGAICNNYTPDLQEIIIFNN